MGLVMSGLTTSCTLTPPKDTTALLDERTGITLAIVDTPLVFARERRDLAVNARDYVSVVTVERNEAGKHSTALVVYRWSTVDPRINEVTDADARQLVLLADGRDIRLKPMPEPLPEEFRPRPRLHLPPVTRLRTDVYLCDGATLAYLAASKQLSAFFADATGAMPYTLWTDGRAALQRFVDTVGID